MLAWPLSSCGEFRHILVVIWWTWLRCLICCWRKHSDPQAVHVCESCQVHGDLDCNWRFCTSTRGLCTGLSSTGPSNKLISNSWHAISLGLCGWLWLQLKFSIGGESVVGWGLVMVGLWALLPMSNSWRPRPSSWGIGLFIVHILLVWLWCGRHFEVRES